MQELQQVMQRIGLQEKEAIVYLTLVKFGKSPISALARNANLSRSSVYDILKHLEEQGYVHQTQISGTAYYLLKDPGLILESLQQKSYLFKSMLPEFVKLHVGVETKPRIQIFEGLENVKSLYRDFVNATEPGGVIMTLSGLGTMSPHLERFIYEQILPLRLEKQIKQLTLSGSRLLHVYGNRDMELEEVRHVKGIADDFENEISLYGGNKLAIIMYKSDELFATVIESPSLYSSMKLLFQLLWNNR